MKRKENKKEKLAESLHLPVEMTRLRSNIYNLNLRKLCINEIAGDRGFAANYHELDKNKLKIIITLWNPG